MEQGADEESNGAIWFQTLLWGHLGFLQSLMILIWPSADGGGEHEIELVPSTNAG